MHVGSDVASIGYYGFYKDLIDTLRDKFRILLTPSTLFTCIEI
jgi:hypothetical protein